MKNFVWFVLCTVGACGQGRPIHPECAGELFVGPIFAESRSAISGGEGLVQVFHLETNGACEPEDDPCAVEINEISGAVRGIFGERAGEARQLAFSYYDRTHGLQTLWTNLVGSGDDFIIMSPDGPIIRADRDISGELLVEFDDWGLQSGTTFILELTKITWSVERPAGELLGCETIGLPNETFRIYAEPEGDP